MTTTTTDIRGPQATVGSVALGAAWSADVSASQARHHHACSINAMPATYEVKTINGFDRRPSEGPT